MNRMIRCQPPPYHSAVYSDSLATKPNSGGTAAMDAAEISPITVTTGATDRKSTRLNSSHVAISYDVFCLKKKKSNESDHVRERMPVAEGPEPSAQGTDRLG